MSGQLDHAALRELAAGAALDDLDTAERAVLDQHLPVCAGCRLLARDLDEVLGDLALAAPELRPPASLRGDVLHALRGPMLSVGRGSAGAATMALPVAGQRPAPRSIPPAGQLPGAGRWRRPALPRWLPMATTVAAGALVLILGVRLTELDDRALLRDAAMAVIADPGHVEVALEAAAIAPDADAIVLFRPGTTEAYLMATDLPPTTGDRVYQLWVADAAGVHGLGTFRHDGEGPFIAPFGHDLAGMDAAMVTIEPPGGAQPGHEPGPTVVIGEL